VRIFSIILVCIILITLPGRPFVSAGPNFTANKPANIKDNDDKDGDDDDKDSDSKDDKAKDKEKDHEKGDKKSDENGWEKVKKFSGRAKTKNKVHKFLVTTKEWRMTFSTEVAEKDAKGKVRAGLFVEVIRDQDGEPKNWKQLDVLYEGDAGGGGTKVFQNGLGDDGKPRWFQIVIAGQMTTYKILVEDHGEKRSTK
jgi:hypothetical protein